MSAPDRDPYPPRHHPLRPESRRSAPAQPDTFAADDVRPDRTPARTPEPAGSYPLRRPRRTRAAPPVAHPSDAAHPEAMIMTVTSTRLSPDWPCQVKSPGSYDWERSAAKWLRE